jgi:tetratricopeptide (TPR) repeat protein
MADRDGLMSPIPQTILIFGLILVACSGIVYFLYRDTDPISVDRNTSVGPFTSTQETINELQQRVNDRPNHAESLGLLGNAYMQRARETEDSMYYDKAEAVLRQAMPLKPADVSLLTAMGVLSLSRHQFVEAKEWAGHAMALSPDSPSAHGLMGDAQVELGEYEGATQSFQTMIDLKPDSNSYARASYIRELFGDVDGAIDAMRQAVEMSPERGEGAAWVRVMLGNLYFKTGDIQGANEQYEEALRAFDGHILALQGLANFRAAEGHYEDAVELYERLIAIRPDVGHLAGLGDVYALKGDHAAAEAQYNQAIEFIAQLDPVNKFLYNREIVLFYANHNLEADTAIQLATAELENRKDIYGYDALAWSLHKGGRNSEAAHAMDQALRLGTQDPMLFYHAGMIHYALGNAERAKTYLEKAVSLNPYFLYGTEVQQTLGELSK